MRFLADESCDFAVVRALRSADHDVMERAVREGRLLITEDKDFGQLV
jgi:predicted nuclease of predicted toxin-antitoxin system